MRRQADRFQAELPIGAWRIPNDRRNRRNDLPKFHTVKAIAESADVSVRTVRRWIKSGALIAHRRNGVVRVADADLKAFWAQNRDA